MGQYHRIANLTTGQGIIPREYGSGWKLMEFAHDSAGPMTLLAALLAGPWKDHRVAIVGDYIENDDLNDTGAFTVPASDMFEAVGDAPRVGNDELAATPVTLRPHPPTRFRPDGWNDIWVTLLRKRKQPEAAMQVVNLDREQSLSGAPFGDPDDFRTVLCESAEGGMLTALAVLLAASCKGGPRGGGDIGHNSDLIGSWAGDRLAVVPVGDYPAFTDVSEQVRSVLIASQEGSYITDGAGTTVRIGRGAQTTALTGWSPVAA